MSSYDVYTTNPNTQSGNVYNYENIPRGEEEVRVGWTVKIWETPDIEGDITIPNMSKKGKKITIRSVWKDNDGYDWITDNNGREWDLYRCMINWC